MGRVTTIGVAGAQPIKLVSKIAMKIVRAADLRVRWLVKIILVEIGFSPFPLMISIR